jgi:hypothetical protein
METVCALTVMPVCVCVCVCVVVGKWDGAAAFWCFVREGVPKGGIGWRTDLVLSRLLAKRWATTEELNKLLYNSSIAERKLKLTLSNT